MFKFNKIVKQFTTYIDQRQFTDSLLQLYKSTETRNIKIINAIYISLISYNCYSYYSDHQKIQLAINDLSIASYRSSMENTQIIGLVLVAGMAMFNWKVNNTLMNMWLQNNGRTVIIQTFSYLGFRSKLNQVEISGFKGVQQLIHPSLRIPVIRYNIGSSRQKNFFKSKYILNEDLMKAVLTAKEIKIRQEGMQMEVSNSQKKKYGL